MTCTLFPHTTHFKNPSILWLHTNIILLLATTNKTGGRNSIWDKDRERTLNLIYAALQSFWLPEKAHKHIVIAYVKNSSLSKHKSFLLIIAAFLNLAFNLETEEIIIQETVISQDNLSVHLDQNYFDSQRFFRFSVEATQITLFFFKWHNWNKANFPVFTWTFPIKN